MANRAPQYPKVVVIGAGSLFFGRQAIWQMTHSPHLRGGTLALVDTDPKRLDSMARLAEMVITSSGAPLALEASTNRLDVLPGADFVVLSFADRSAYFRGIDCRVAETHGCACARAIRLVLAASSGQCASFRSSLTVRATSRTCALARGLSTTSTQRP